MGAYPSDVRDAREAAEVGAINATAPDMNTLFTPEVPVVVLTPDQVHAAEPERHRAIMANANPRARAIFENVLLPALASGEYYHVKNGRAHLWVRLLIPDQSRHQFVRLVEDILPIHAPCYECYVYTDGSARAATYVIIELTERDKSPAPKPRPTRQRPP
jgi:hypothetical protein